ncbi:MAG: hydrogenase maturation protease [Devosia nanyangense]|uniref:Hydrogenase maturation protease n=1 Tax=Devosia nanyangense TaxID=1228055 RepID=A0A933NVB5_9HYPH|nr:hydrogenase maturation protease [Devosia nanyangense]
MSRLMIIGLGNPDRGDDGVGGLVVEALAGRLPEGVETMVRTGDMLGLVEDWAGAQAVICIDAAATVGAPGRVHRIDGHAEALLPEPGLASSHAFGLAEAIALSRALGTAPPVLFVYAIEGSGFDTGAPVSAEVAAVVDEVATRVLAEVARWPATAEAIRA